MSMSAKTVSDLGFSVAGIVKSISKPKINKFGNEQQSILLAIGDSLFRVMMLPIHAAGLKINDFIECPIRISYFKDKDTGEIITLGYRQ